jgi:hypothetical protein
MSKQVATYIPDDEYEDWEEQAEEMGMSKSDWIKSMVRAGQKKFNRDVEPTESRDDLRQRRNDLRQELQRARDRIEELEGQVHRSEREAVIDYIDENPGAQYGQVVQHVVNTANSRVTRILDDVEGDEIEIDEQGRMYRR